MDGCGRAFDDIYVERLWRNVKYEDVYLNGYATLGELLIGLMKYFAFYNAERMHQSLANQTPDAVYASGMGGGALIVDKFPRKEEELPAALRSTGSSSEQTKDQKTKSKSGQRRPAESEIEGSLNGLKNCLD